ncbi:MAG: hypothetical protein BWY68_00562 [bacterium ADurb.Bin400]|nr:MAG: hypothetical protein BWY68_00562 [bacterium ADurb.Bin400]
MTVNVTWEANDTNLGLAPIELRYSIDDFLTSELIASDLANTGTYSWTIPFISGTSAKVKVIVADIQGNIAQDISDAAFTVNSNPIFTVTPVEKSGERYIKAEWLGIGGGVEQYLISVDGNIREAITVSGNDLGVPYVRELKVLEARKYSVSVVARSMGVYAASPAVKSVLFTAPATVSSVTGVEGDGAAASDSAGARPAAPGRAQAEPPAPQPPAETPEDGETTGDENGIIRGEDQTEDEGVNWTPWIILFILIILVGAATGGYFYWFGGEEETTAATKAPAEEPKKVSEQPKSEVVRAQKKRPGGKRSKRW